MPSRHGALRQKIPQVPFSTKIRHTATLDVAVVSRICETRLPTSVHRVHYTMREKRDAIMVCGI